MSQVRQTIRYLTVGFALSFIANSCLAGDSDSTTRGISGGNDLRGISGGNDLRGISGGNDLRGISGGNDLRGISGGNDLRGISGGNALRGISGGNDLRGISGGNDLLGISGGNDLRSISGGNDVRGISGGNDLRSPATFDSIAIGPVESVTRDEQGTTVSVLGQTYRGAVDLADLVSPGEYVFAGGNGGALGAILIGAELYVPGSTQVNVRGVVTNVD